MTTQDSRLRALERHAGRKGRDVTDDPRAALRRRLDQLAARRGPCDEQDLDDVREGLNARLVALGYPRLAVEGGPTHGGATH
jgi:hypothetical protein